MFEADADGGAGSQQGQQAARQISAAAATLRAATLTLLRRQTTVWSMILMCGRIHMVQSTDCGFTSRCAAACKVSQTWSLYATHVSIGARLRL